MRAAREAAVVLGLLSALLGSGCERPNRVGHFNVDAFYAGARHYRVRFDDTGRELLPMPWRLVNVERDRAGAPRQTLHGPSWLDRYELGGRRPVSFARLELLFRQPGPATGALWARSLPLGPAWSGRSGPATAAAIADGWRHGQMSLPLVPREVRLDVHSFRAAQYGPAVVDGRPAGYASGAGRDLAGDPIAITVVVVDAGRALTVRGERFPLLLVIGVATPPAEAEAGRLALHRLARRVDLPFAR